MPSFHYSALSGEGERIAGMMEGTDRASVLLRLSEAGHHPIEVVETSPSRPGRSWASLRRSVASFADITLFTRDLAWLLKAGLNLSAALDMLAKEAEPRFAALIGDLRSGVRRGRAFHEALSDSGAFSPYYVSMIEIAEASGTLVGVLERIAQTREREERIRRQITSALIYPLVLIALATGAIVFIMVYVVPSLKDLILGSGGPVPESARFVIGMSDWLIAHGLTLLVA